MRKSRELLIGCALFSGVAGAALSPPQLAAACSRALPQPFELDPSLRGIDTQAPSAFSDVHGSVRQISGTRCSGNTCTSSSCGDSGMLELTFEAPQDDRSAVQELGYRVVWLSGSMPSGLRQAIDNIQPLYDAHSISIELGFADVTQLNGQLALVAVDRAGNESAQSQPVHVQWNGCMSYFDAPEVCEAKAHACAVARGVRGADAPWWLPLMAAVGFARCARSRANRHNPAH